MQRNNPVNTAKLFELRSNARLANQLKKGQDPDRTGALFVKRLADAFEQDMTQCSRCFNRIQHRQSLYLRKK